MRYKCNMCDMIAETENEMINHSFEVHDVFPEGWTIIE